VCVAYLRQKRRVNFRSTKVDAGKLKRRYLDQPWSTLAVKVLKALCHVGHLSVITFTCLSIISSNNVADMQTCKVLVPLAHLISGPKMMYTVTDHGKICNFCHSNIFEECKITQCWSRRHEPQ
jgi:hypothetical protein